MPGIEFTPFGMQPIGASILAQPEEGLISGATANVLPLPAPIFHPMAPAQAVKIQHAAPPKPLSQRDIIKAARAELRATEKEIKRLRKLEKHRDELRRLLDAADGKTRPAIRSLPTRSA